MNSKPSTSLSQAALPDAAPDSRLPMGGTTEKESHKPGPVAPNAKGDGMLLFLTNKMRQLNMDALTFFRVAHVWAFGTDPDLHDDVAQFLLHGVVPIYVRNYLKTLQA